MKTEPNQPQQGTAWTSENMKCFVDHAPIHPRIRSPFALTITGTGDEIQQHLDGPRLRCIIEDIDEALRAYAKYGHKFKDADEAIEWVRQELAEGIRE